jgi:NTP pyrophosphatase (non-canonical NTP hydrolase)
MSQPKSVPSHKQGPISADDRTTVHELKEVMREFVSERNWHCFHNAKNLSMSLAIEAAELMEHFQWLTTEQVTGGQGFDQGEVADELADVLCYALSLANALHIDISSAIKSKMHKNRRKYPANDAPPQAK